MAMAVLAVLQEVNQPAKVVWFGRTTAVEIHLLLLSFLILPSAFHVGCGLDYKMELLRTGPWSPMTFHTIPVGLNEACIPQHIFSLSL